MKIKLVWIGAMGSLLFSSGHAQPTAFDSSASPVADSVILSKDSLALGDSLADTVDAALKSLLLPDSLSDSVSDSGTVPMFAEGGHKGKGGVAVGICWSIVLVPQIDEWQNAVRQVVTDSSKGAVEHHVEKDFEGFSNAFVPHVGVEWHYGKRLSLGLDMQYVRLTKEMVYSDEDTSIAQREIFKERLILQTIPLSIWLTASLPESVVTVQGFNSIYVGVGMSGAPWAKLVADGRFQSNAWGIGQSIGFLLKLGIEKEASARWWYRGEIRYGYAPVPSFAAGSANLSQDQLLGQKGQDFSLDYSHIQLLVKFIFHKPDPNWNRRRQQRSYQRPSYRRH